jgi:hypothetical protein
VDPSIFGPNDELLTSLGGATCNPQIMAVCLFLRIGRERERESDRIVILHSTGWTGINTRAVAVLLYSAVMRRKVAGERTDVVSGALERSVEVPGVGVGASTGCAHIAFAGPNPNIIVHRK